MEPDQPPKKRLKLDETNARNEGEEIQNSSYKEPLSAAEIEKNVRPIRREVEVIEQDEKGKAFAALMTKVPPEIWEIIFTNLENSPDDFHLVINSNNNWRQLLSSKFATVFFPNLLPLLAPYLPPHALLQCREVCKTWKRHIDTHLETYPISTDSFEGHWWHSDSPFSRSIRHLDRNYFFDIHNIGKFMESMEAERNPFISRSVSIRLGGANNFNNDYDECLNFLKKFGDHIWDFSSFCPALESAEAAAVQRVPEMLQRLPNLRSLKIDWNTNALSRVPREILEELRRGNRPFPPMAHLHSLNFDFRGGGILERVMGQALLRSYGAQLTTLVCRGELLEMDYINPDSISDLLPSLRNLRIFSVTEQVLRKLSQVRNLPLQRLQLWYSFQSLQYGNLIRAINPFSQSLVQLHMDIKLEFPYMFGIDNQENMVLPEEMNIKFDQLKMLSAPMSCVNCNWFWDMLKFKFRGLHRIDLQTAMESLFAPYQSKYLKREVDQAKRFFNFLNNLDKIWVWFHNEGNIVLRRKSV